ncbi:MAG: molybdopterin-dependent oxidoreductase, partial [Firmicutes bacterium]|nr:molybdopterin-dependent oxidoreductase [Bacillota bacterium]
MARKRSPLFRSLAYLRRGRRINQGWTEENPRDRQWEDLYRARWQHDKVVRSTHGVNCTGSCSWKVHVKDGIVTWETQATDYPSIGPDMPEYEPRGCPRGASFSWYLYSPMRVKYPYVRSALWRAWQAARSRTGDPVRAWETLRQDRVQVAAWQQARGKGGFVRVSWDEAAELVAAALVDTIRAYGPDRIAGFSPIPAMSMVSFAAGSRFLSLLGGSMLSFYDWYADLPPASPQVWGEQTDVPESADWYNSRYLIIWGTNLPMTRTPDAHFMVEARYNGTKVVEVSPDYAEAAKFADEWLPARPGTDGALAMAMTHVILTEFYRDHSTPYFEDYVKQYTDLPFLVTLEAGPGEANLAGRFVTAADLGLEAGEHAAWKTVLWDDQAGEPVVPPGSLGFRWDGSGRWNLHLEREDGSPIVPRLSFLDAGVETVLVQFPYFGNGRAEAVVRGVPVRRLRFGDGSEHWVTTVFDLLMAHVGVDRGLPGDYPRSYEDPRPYTPAWQEAITGVPQDQVIRVAREFAATAARTRGRALIAMGGGTNHWYHSDVTYRAMLNLVLLTGSQGVNGGGWAHYVGQEKVRPLEGWQTLAAARDWGIPARQQNGTLFFYTASEQFRYETLDPGTLVTPWAGPTGRLHLMDLQALAVRLGWLPSYPQFTRNPLDLVAEARREGARDEAAIAAYVARRLESGQL